MTPLVGSVISGVNELLEDQRRGEEPCRVTLALFDGVDPFELVLDAAPIEQARPIGPEDYRPRWGTPLHDALWRTLDHAAARGVEGERQIVVTFTDGEENSSREVSADSLRARIEALRAEGWAFEFFGANQDEALASRTLGIDASSAHGFVSSAPGTREALRHASRVAHEHRDRMRRQRHGNRPESEPSGEEPGDA